MLPIVVTAPGVERVVGVQFVTEVALVVFLGPLGIDILLCTLMGFSFDRHRALFDDFYLFTLVALHRRRHQRGIDDLAAACQIAMREQLLLHLAE